LIFLCPLSHSIEVLTAVLCVEVDIRLRALRINPDLTENSGVDCAHKLLAKNIEAMGL
jgi:hypothetical protein